MVLFKKTTAKTCLAQYSVYLSTVYIYSKLPSIV